MRSIARVVAPDVPCHVIQRANTQADMDLWFSYYCGDTSSTSYNAIMHPRFDINTEYDDRVRVVIRSNQMWLDEGVDGVYTRLDTNMSATTSQDTWYDVYVNCDGSDIEVWRGVQGGTMSKVLETSSCTVTTTTHLPIEVSMDAQYRFDDITVVTDALETTTFVYNNANELTSMTSGGTTTNFAYDDWGRTISKYDGTYSAAYGYRYGDKLYSVTADFPGEGTVTYQYGGDGTRRERTAAGVTTKYNWTVVWNIVNEETSAGTLSMTYVLANPALEVSAVLADVSGTTPSTGTYRYYSLDNLGATRGLRDASKVTLGTYQYTPYGDEFSQTGASLASLGRAFTGKPWDATAHLYYFPYRYYAPSLGRWLTRDPLGMVDGPNMYGYVRDRPTINVDSLGLRQSYGGRWVDCMNDCLFTISCAGCLVFSPIGAVPGAVAGGVMGAPVGGIGALPGAAVGGLTGAAIFWMYCMAGMSIFCSAYCAAWGHRYY